MHALVTRSAATCCRSAWRACARWRPACQASACPRRSPSRRICAACSCRSRSRRRHGRPRRRRQAGRSPTSRARYARARAVGRATPRATPSRRSTSHQAQQDRRWSSSTRAARRRCCSRSSGASTTTTCRSRCITARSTSASAARSRRRWRTDSLRAVVCTSTLDLGIDWGDVDLVIHVGAPKGARRLVQRIGRANHRLDEPSQALLVPANRFEVLECRAAREAVAEGALDAAAAHGALDCSPSTSWAAPAASRSTPTNSTTR